MPETNLPILYQNILFGLPEGIAHDAFLWAVERPGDDRMCYRAEGFAREVHTLVDRLSPMMDTAARLHGRSNRDADLMAFILQRHANWRMGSNLHPPYAKRAA